MLIQRKYFFDSVRSSLFGGSLNQSQVDGLNTLLDYAEEIGIDDRHLAYLLATAAHETAWTMQPIKEYGEGKGKPYGEPAGPYNQRYYGRGYVQLTWFDNYQKQDDKLKLKGELVKNPDLALDPEIARQILFHGCLDGDFTGICLGDHIICADPATDVTDYFEARTVVNGHDRATDIKNYAIKFANGITHAARPESRLEP
jgi:putative chitinase